MEIIIPVFLELVAPPEPDKPKKIKEPRIRKIKFKVIWGNSSNRDLAKKAALSAKRHAAKLLALPKWADLEAISSIYQLSRAMSIFYGIKYEVDHIIPLKSPLVCGLHWEGNLQVITKKNNMLKRCSFPS